MYALFTAIPLVGHINPLLRQAEALQRRGHQVAFAGASELRTHVSSEAPSVRFIDLGPLGPIARELRDVQARASMDPSFVRGAQRIVDSLWRVWPGMYDGLRAAMAAEPPDVVVADLFSSAGLSAADAAGVPCVVNNPDLLGAISPRILPPADHLPLLFSGLSPRQLTPWHRLAAPLLRRAAAVYASATVGRRLNALRASRGLPPVDVHELLRGRQVLVDGAFGIEYERPLPSNVAMVGAMLPERTAPLPPGLAEWLAAGPPVVYVNLGTIAIAPDAQLAKMAAAFTAGHTFRTLWILRPDQASRLPSPPPAALRVLDWGPAPAAVLSHPNVKMFVSHCGINSVYESIHAGTPIVGIPMFADQRDMAVRVADAGIGVWLDKRRFTAAALHAAILRVLDDAAFVRAIPAAQQALADAGGASRAADLIERAVRVQAAA
jgi:MGT family glycosyltransferase